MIELNVSYSSVQAVAEIIEERIEPAMKVGGLYHFETICEDVRNAYAFILWKTYMAWLADGERTIPDALLTRKSYPATETTTSLKLHQLMIVDLPRDAGVFAVMPLDANDMPLCTRPMVKTTSTQACQEYKIKPGFRYYRVGDSLYFPDGLPPCTAKIQLDTFGLNLDGATSELIPREYADQVRDKVWAAYFPSKQIPADITNNQNPNQ